MNRLLLPFLQTANLGLLLATITLSAEAIGATFPSRPVRMVVGFTPGGQPYITARLLQPRLYEALGQQVIVDNRPGAGGVVAAKIVADADADGHTLLFVSSSHVAIPAVRASLPYDTVRDFAGITLTSTACYVLVVPTTLSVKTAQELIALAKTNPGQLNYGSGGTGSGAHFAAEMFKHTTAIDAVHVPYRGIPEALTDLISGRLHFFMSPLASAVSLVRQKNASPSTQRCRPWLNPVCPVISGIRGRVCWHRQKPRAPSSSA